MNRAALTLTELAFALLVVTVGVTASMMVFPVALKGLQEARYRLVAASLVQTLVRSSGQNLEWYLTSEGERATDRPYSNASTLAPDLENHFVTGPGGGFVPLPPAIAARLDSDGDEIARILGEGGGLYVARMGISLDVATLSAEQSRIVIGIRGAPQQNLLNFHPQVRWPYLDHLPVPFQVESNHRIWLYEPLLRRAVGQRHDGGAALGGSVDGGLVALTGSQRRHRIGQGDVDPDSSVPGPADDAAAFLAAAMSDDLGTLLEPPTPYAGATGLTRALLMVGIDMNDVFRNASARPTLAELAAAYGSTPESRLRYAVRCALLRFYAWRAGQLCIGKGNPQNEAAAFPEPADADIVNGQASIRRRYQLALEWAIAYHRYLHVWQPYDLRAPVDLSFMTFTNTPLLQFDLAAPPAQTAPMHAWRILSSRPVLAEGSATWGAYPGTYRNDAATAIDPGLRSPGDGWNLTAPFTPAERMREVVAWAVDWQSYEDFEMVQGAPPASALLTHLPPRNRGQNWYDTSAWVDDGKVSPEWAYQNASPEYLTAWTGPDRSRTVRQDEAWPNVWTSRNIPDARANWWTAMHGADRNGNGRFDRGTVKASVRLRAVEVARFLVYDPRGWVQDN